MNKWVPRIIASILVLFAIVCALALILPDNTNAFEVDGPSMQPTLQSGEMVNTDKTVIPKVQDIVVFKYNDKIFIKRLIHIKDNNYWVEGDNKANSEDSRSFGWLNRSNIEYLGVVFETN